MSPHIDSILRIESIAGDIINTCGVDNAAAFVYTPPLTLYWRVLTANKESVVVFPPLSPSVMAEIHHRVVAAGLYQHRRC